MTGKEGSISIMQPYHCDGVFVTILTCLYKDNYKLHRIDIFGSETLLARYYYFFFFFFFF